jgi:hypothetical protein
MARNMPKLIRTRKFVEVAQELRRKASGFQAFPGAVEVAARS